MARGMTQENDKAEGKGERIAKVLARAGVASRRDAEGIVTAGRVAVNGRRIDSPALNVTPRDRITLDGKPLPEPEPARLWLYHKPLGQVSTARDEKGRETVFDKLPEGLPRLMSVGRLDINSEGLLLLTNDGELKRRLELPSTGWLRKYRVRVNGRPTDESLAPLRDGITVEGERFQPMVVGIDRQQGANAWLTVGIREGRNREVRRAMEHVGLVVNRLIRVSYGPFQLGQLAPGAVIEVKPRVLRDQLGLTQAPEGGAKPGQRAGAGARKAVKSGAKGAKPGLKAPGAARGARTGAKTGSAGPARPTLGAGKSGGPARTGGAGPGAGPGRRPPPKKR